MGIEPHYATPPPLPQRAAFARSDYRAMFAGFACHVAILYRFNSYTARNNTPPVQFVYFCLGMLVLGGLWGWFTAAWKRSAHCLTLGACGALALEILADWIDDPSNHNMLPFEFIALLLMCLPAYVGAWISNRVHRASSGGTSSAGLSS